MDPSRLIKPSVRAMEAYEAPVYPCRVKLDAAEGPYPPPPPLAMPSPAPIMAVIIGTCPAKR